MCNRFFGELLCRLCTAPVTWGSLIITLTIPTVVHITRSQLIDPNIPYTTKKAVPSRKRKALSAMSRRSPPAMKIVVWPFFGIGGIMEYCFLKLLSFTLFTLKYQINLINLRTLKISTIFKFEGLSLKHLNLNIQSLGDWHTHDKAERPFVRRKINEALVDAHLKTVP